jgi:ribonuclease D
VSQLAGEALITSKAQLVALADHLRSSGRFAFDTEFVSEETYEPVLCLIQVGTRDRLAIVDPLAVSDLTPFWDGASSMFKSPRAWSG